MASAVSTGERIELLHSKYPDEARQLLTPVFCEHRLEVIASYSLDYRHGHLRTGHLSFSQISYGAEVTIDPGTREQFYLVQPAFCRPRPAAHRWP